ncbi:MAG: ATP-binding protein [Acidimicrobiales bacterium]
MYDTPAELIAAIAAGEDSYLELKELVAEGTKLTVAGEGRATSWIARQLSAFTNTDGGALVLGVADDGTIVGIDRERMDEVQQWIINIGRNNVEPPVDHLLRLDAMALPGGEEDRLVLRVDVRADFYAVHAPQGQRPQIRVGNTTREVSMELLPRLLARRGVLLSADERPVVGAQLADLAWSSVEGYHMRRFSRPPDDLHRFAGNLKLVTADDRGDAHPTVAGILLFGRDPQAHLPHARIEIVAYRGSVPDTNERLDARTVGGTVLDQIDVVTSYFARSPSIQFAASKDGNGRTDLPQYSLRALQEAVVNAIAHRDYGLAGAHVRVQLFDDRIEVTSPGRLPNSLSPADLFAGAQPIRRNQVLVGFLVQPAATPTGVSYMEGNAEGFLTMVRETEALSGRRPELVLGTEAVTVVIPAARLDPSRG